MPTTPGASATPQAATACTSVTSDGAAAVNSIGLFTTACNVESSLMTQTLINGFPGVNLAGNNAGLLLNGTGTHQVTVTGATSGRLGQDASGFFFASDTKNSNVRFLTNNGTLNEWMRITSAGNVGIGTTTPAAKLDINGNLNLPNTASATVGVISLGVTPFAHRFGTKNTFVGQGAGNFTLTGISNSAYGFQAFLNNTTGFQNTAIGTFALQSNTTGSSNTAIGASALGGNTNGNNNTASGIQALAFNTSGSNNTANGLAALVQNTIGNSNTVDCAIPKRHAVAAINHRISPDGSGVRQLCRRPRASAEADKSVAGASRVCIGRGVHHRHDRHSAGHRRPSQLDHRRAGRRQWHRRGTRGIYGCGCQRSASVLPLWCHREPHLHRSQYYAAVRSDGQPLDVCGASPAATAGPGDILVFRICNTGVAGQLDFSVTSVEFVWQ